MSFHLSPTMKLAARSIPYWSARVEQKAWVWLTAGTVVSVVIADENRGDRRLIQQAHVHRLDHLAALSTAGDVWLIGRADQEKPRVMQPAQSFRNAGQDLEPLERIGWVRSALADEGAVQDAVAVKEDSPAGRSKGPIAGSSDRLPFGLARFQVRVRDQQVPDDRLKRLGMRSDVVGVDCRDDDARRCHFRRVAAVLAHDTDHGRPYFASVVERAHEVRTDVLLEIPAADREDEEQVSGCQSAHSQPFDEDRRPALIVGPCRQLRDVVGRSVCLDPDDLAMPMSIPRASSAPISAPSSASQVAESIHFPRTNIRST